MADTTPENGKSIASTKIGRRRFIKGVSAGIGASTLEPSAAMAGFRPKAVDYRRKTILSSEKANMKPVYDFAIVGSGYGGGVAAARISEKNSSVCVLERGKEYHPGDFPETASGVFKSIKTPLNQQGMFELEYYGDATVVSASGLGGTSLINHNVASEPDPDVFDMENWPSAIREDRDSGKLWEYYQKAREMLKPEAFPENQTLAKKADVLKSTSERVGADFQVADVYVNYTKFQSEANHAGVMQHPCIMCGNCLTGCNVGAKNTVNMNYLPWAKRNGAEIYSEIEVDHFEKLASGLYRIYYSEFDRKGRKSSTGKYVDAHNLIISAGTMGSNKIMRRSQQVSGLSVSSRLGMGFSGNGDTIGFGYNGRERTNIESFGNRVRYFWEAIVGPGTVALARHNKNDRADQRFVIEDASIPSAVVKILQSTAFVLAGFPDSFAAFKRVITGAILRSSNGALNHSQLYLGVGHDGAEGQIQIKNDKFCIKWPNIKNNPYLKKIDQAMQDHTDAQQGEYIGNPLGYITTHPLGGCSMGDDAATGVVNHRCQVFDPDSRTNEVHQGLYVIDGSVIPNSLGTNPSLSITAIAERAVAFITET